MVRWERGGDPGKILSNIFTVCTCAPIDLGTLEGGCLLSKGVGEEVDGRFEPPHSGPPFLTPLNGSGKR